jgi:hypothetical protein
MKKKKIQILKNEFFFLIIGFVNVKIYPRLGMSKSCSSSY